MKFTVAKKTKVINIYNYCGNYKTISTVSHKVSIIEENANHAKITEFSQMRFVIEIPYAFNPCYFNLDIRNGFRRLTVI